MEAVRDDLGQVTHYERGESPEYSIARLMVWLFILGAAILTAVRLTAMQSPQP